jgi:hypothetical protein
MPKEDTNEKEATGSGKDSKAAADKDKSGSDVDSSSELEAVKSEKGEPSDNLRRRAEWFQKRTGGG